MKTIVITGSTRGIGYGLADSFLALGCAVTVSGRTQEGVDGAVATLSAKHEAGRVMGHPCDVTHYAQVQALWDAAHAHWGRVDVWINNAGGTHLQAEFWELEPEQIKAVVDANLLGAMYGSKVALRGMLAQGSGSLYSMEGLGSTGRKMDGLAVYGTTKCGLRYLNESLAHEVRETPVLVGALRPGMVVTDMLTGKKRPSGRLGTRQAHFQHPCRPRRDGHALAGSKGARQRQERRLHLVDEPPQDHVALSHGALSQT